MRKGCFFCELDFSASVSCCAINISIPQHSENQRGRTKDFWTAPSLLPKAYRAKL